MGHKFFQLAKEPLLHFLLIGVAIYLFYGVFAEPALEETDKTIVVSAGEETNQSWWALSQFSFHARGVLLV